MGYVSMIDWNPLIAAGAELLRSYTFLAILVITWACLLFGRDRIAAWIEAVGADGVREFLAGYGNSTRNMLRAQREAAAPTTNNVADLRRP